MYIRMTYFNEETGKYEVRVNRTFDVRIDSGSMIISGDLVERLARFENAKEKDIWREGLVKQADRFKSRPIDLIEMFVESNESWYHVDYQECGWSNGASCRHALSRAIIKGKFKNVKVSCKNDEVFLFKEI